MTRIKTHSSILTMGDGGTWSYGGTADPLNMLPPFDKGIKLVRGRTRTRFRVRTTPGTPGSVGPRAGALDDRQQGQLGGQRQQGG